MTTLYNKVQMKFQLHLGSPKIQSIFLKSGRRRVTGESNKFCKIARIALCNNNKANRGVIWFFKQQFGNN
jgi:hypothetical protein